MYGHDPLILRTTPLESRISSGKSCCILQISFRIENKKKCLANLVVKGTFLYCICLIKIRFLSKNDFFYRRSSAQIQNAQYLTNGSNLIDSQICKFIVSNEVHTFMNSKYSLKLFVFKKLTIFQIPEFAKLLLKYYHLQCLEKKKI